MVDAVFVKTLRNTDSEAAFFMGSVSDGTGESAIQKVDISALTMAAAKVTITKLIWGCQGMGVKVLFDHNTDDAVAILAGMGHLSDEKEAPIQDPGSAGGTGDILFTTFGQAAGTGYGIYMEIRKVS